MASLYFYNWPLLIKAFWDKKELIKFAEGVHAAVIQADIGRGKSLLLSILAYNLSTGI